MCIRDRDSGVGTSVKEITQILKRAYKSESPINITGDFRLGDIAHNVACLLYTSQNIGMKGFIQRYGIVNAVKRGAFMFIKLHLVKDYEVRKVLWQERASTKIKPYLKYKDTAVSYTHLDVYKRQNKDRHAKSGPNGAA